MIVMKFGGTSVGERANLQVAVEQVRRRAREAGEKPVVVVSALAGVTDAIAQCCDRARGRKELAPQVAQHHRAYAKEVGLDPHVLDGPLESWRIDAEPLAGTTRKVVDADRDRLLSHGERLAAELFAAALRKRGAAASAVLAGDAGLVTDERFGAAHPLPVAEGLLQIALMPREDVVVMTGFLGRTTDGRITTLGRGGSDYTAAIVGAALGAEEIQIWTDTSGLLSADPRVVPEARTVPHLSFAEASELATFGAKVLHPKTLLPAIDRRIPVRVLNTTRPDDAGTLILPSSDEADTQWRVKSIACKAGIRAITIASTRMLLAHGFLARVFEIFGRHQIVVDLVTTSEVSISVTVDDDAVLDEAIRELEEVGRVEMREGLAVVAVVGEGAPTRVGLAGHLFTLLGGVGIVVEMISQGASRVNLSFVVSAADAERAVRLLHRGLGLDVEAPVGAEAAGR